MDSKSKPLTIYSNLLQVRITPAELVLEFGAYFPDQGNSPPQAVPKDFSADVRIVLNAGALDQLTGALLKAAEARKAASQQPPNIAKAQ